MRLLLVIVGSQNLFNRLGLRYFLTCIKYEKLNGYGRLCFTCESAAVIVFFVYSWAYCGV